MTAPVLIVEGGTALMGEDLSALDNATIRIENGLIERDEGSSPPPAAERIDARGLTLLPGFIDAHVHIGFFDPLEVAMGGVTYVRDLGWPADEIFPLAERSQADDFPGPRIGAVGTMITAPEGYPTRAAWAPPGTGTPVADAGEARSAVQATVERGAAAIKISLNPPVGPVLAGDVLEVIVGTAHDAGLKVTGHIYGLDELIKALDAGIDELAHMLMSPELIPTSVLRRMVDEGVAIVPTLSIRTGSDRATAIENLRRFIELGGRVVYGTDLGNEGPGPGIDRSEVTAMAEAGMSPGDIIRSATVEAAGWLGLADTGVLRDGARADLIGVRGDPLDDPMALTQVELVIRGGRRLR